MPVQLKDPSIQEDRLEFAEVDSLLEIQQIMHEPETHLSVAKFFAPKSFVAKSEFEKRKESQRQHKEWMANIAQRRSALQQNQQRITQMVTDSRKSGSGGVGI